MVRLFVQMVGGPRKEMVVDATRCTVGQLCDRIGQEFSCPSSSLKLVSSGSVLGEDAAHGKLLLRDLKEGGERQGAMALRLPLKKGPQS